MKVAISIIPETGRISPVFETARHVLMIHVGQNGACSVISQETLPEYESGKIDLMHARGVGLVICGAICNETRNELFGLGIRVIPFVSGEWNAVVDAIFHQSETLPADYIMPGCGCHHKQCCRLKTEKKRK